jgi:hypothetical protein
MKIIATTSCLFILCIHLIASPVPVPPQNTGRVYPNDRTGDDGKLWLGWDHAKRQGYVLGYVYGQTRGYRDGCLAFEDAARSNSELNLKTSPLQKCMSKEPQYPKDADHYEAQITAFYEQYPTDRNMPLGEIFRLLSDGRANTLDEIHQSFHDH